MFETVLLYTSIALVVTLLLAMTHPLWLWIPAEMVLRWEMKSLHSSGMTRKQVRNHIREMFPKPWFMRVLLQKNKNCNNKCEPGGLLFYYSKKWLGTAAE